MPRLARLRRTSRPIAARKATAAGAFGAGEAGLERVLDFAVATIWDSLLGLFAGILGGINAMHYNAYRIMPAGHRGDNRPLAQNPPVAVALCCCRLALVDRVGTRIVGRVNERNDGRRLAVASTWFRLPRFEPCFRFDRCRFARG